MLPKINTNKVILHEEVIYACGCTTTRIEKLRGREAIGEICHGHGERIIKCTKTIEYIEDSASEINAQQQTTKQ